MTSVVGVRFRTVGKIYYFDPQDQEVSRGTHVIVETVRGIEYGTVITGPKEVEDEEVVKPLKPILRVATEEDEARESYNRAREQEAFVICREKIKEHQLEMKLIQAEYTFDNNKLLFYFTADGRIDFRDLVKDLASSFRTRIELRQIGVRDETKILGGVGICGRELCCHTFLSDFAPVSIKMAKEQNLSLNPTKISGTCGRLMCCLNNEAETYEFLNSRLPRQGSYVLTPEGVTGRVQSVSVLRQHVKVIVENGDEREIHEYSIDELNEARRRKEEGTLWIRESTETKRQQTESRTKSENGQSRGKKRTSTGADDEGQVRRREERKSNGRNGETTGGNKKNQTSRSDQSGSREQNRNQNKNNQSGSQEQNRNQNNKNRYRNHRRRKRPNQAGDGKKPNQQNGGGNNKKNSQSGNGSKKPE